MNARNWGLSGWLTFVAGCFVLAGAAFGLLAYDRRLFLLACGIGAFGYCCYRIPNRNLLAELEAARDRLSAYNASDSRADLAEAPLTPPRGVEPIEVEPFMSDSGYRPPRSATGANGVGSAHFIDRGRAAHDGLAYIRGQYGVPAEMDGHVIVDGRPGLIVGAQDAHLLVEFDEDETLPCHPTWRVEYRSPEPPEEVQHLGQACEYGVRLHEDCGDPADRWVMVGGAPWWLCRRHYADVIERGETDIDRDASDVRSLPTRRVSD